MTKIKFMRVGWLALVAGLVLMQLACGGTISTTPAAAPKKEKAARRRRPRKRRRNRPN